MIKSACLALIALCGLTACANTESLDALRTATPTGTPYTIALTKNYTAYAEELAADYEWDASSYFAQKGLRAAQGESVAAESPSAWQLPADVAQPLDAVRERLTRAVGTNTTTQPEIAASAMLAFDQLIALHDANAPVDAITEQHGVLDALLVKLEEAYAASETAPPPPPTIASEIRRTVLYFPLDGDHLGESALGALSELSREVAAPNTSAIAINGHADRVGGDDYNLHLSERRARVVLKALEKAGIAASRMQHFAFGESDPAIPTEDGVQEPKNRRVEITIE
jgi:OmpA-OmpF porin, OOP family